MELVFGFTPVSQVKLLGLNEVHVHTNQDMRSLGLCADFDGNLHF